MFKIEPITKLVSELIRSFDEGTLLVDETIQRKLVWKDAHKIKFIETVLEGFPFPEVYIQASNEFNIHDQPIEYIIDGYQRISTLYDYAKGRGVFALTKKIKPYSNLDNDEKSAFIKTLVSVRLVSATDKTIIKEIFQRINSTEYSLTTTEKRNAMYGESELWLFTRQLFEHDFSIKNHVLNFKINMEDRKIFNDFFNINDIFSDNDFSRMYSSQFGLIMTCTIINYIELNDDDLYESGNEFFDREVDCENKLEEFNENFCHAKKILKGYLNVINFLNLCSLHKYEYWVTKSCIFSLFIELFKYDINQLSASKFEKELKNYDDKFRELYNLQKFNELEASEFDFFKSSRIAINQASSRRIRSKFIGEIIKKCFK